MRRGIFILILSLTYSLLAWCHLLLFNTVVIPWRVLKGIEWRIKGGKIITEWVSHVITRCCNGKIVTPTTTSLNTPFNDLIHSICSISSLKLSSPICSTTLHSFSHQNHHFFFRINSPWCSSAPPYQPTTFTSFRQ